MRKLLLLFALLLFFAVPLPVYAHAFGQIYTLPLPVWLYLYGGGGAVLVSFLLICFFINRKDDRIVNSKAQLPTVIAKAVLSGETHFLLLLISAVLYAMILISGFFGTRESNANFAPVYVWIVFWLGFTYISAVFGNLWPAVNPRKIVTDIIERLSGREIKGFFAYPKKLGYLPALLGYYSFIWLELLSNGFAVKPGNLAAIALLYMFISLSGIFLIGKAAWFTYCDFFSVFFRLIARIAPFKVLDGKIFLRMPFIGLLEDGTDSFSLVLFILFMLSSTAFDGFRSTVVFAKLDRVIVDVGLSGNQYVLIESVLLALSPAFFFVLYMWAVTFMKLLVKTQVSIWDLAIKFSLSLVPIALAYNIAHYYALLIVTGQQIIPLVSDPLARGWNLFGTAGYQPNIGIVSASFVWNTQVAAIIIGHIAAVYIAHMIALRVLPSYKNAIYSQLPMLFLMIVYTITGLWILSQPLSLGR